MNKFVVKHIWNHDESNTNRTSCQGKFIIPSNMSHVTCYNSSHHFWDQNLIVHYQILIVILKVISLLRMTQENLVIPLTLLISGNTQLPYIC
jgi:hypothetical protein